MQVEKLHWKMFWLIWCSYEWVLCIFVLMLGILNALIEYSFNIFCIQNSMIAAYLYQGKPSFSKSFPILNLKAIMLIKKKDRALETWGKMQECISWSFSTHLHFFMKCNPFNIIWSELWPAPANIGFYI